MTLATRYVIAQGFVDAGIPQVLVEETLETFSEARRRSHLGDFMPNAIEGGRFTEAVLRILQWQATSVFTPLGNSKFKADNLIKQLENESGCVDSVRFHIPRALRVIYGFRNKRDTGHLADGIDPNAQDASLIIAIMNWVMAELVRMYHSVPPTEAQARIEELVSWEVPIIEVFNGRPRILRDVKAGDLCLVLLYWAGRSGVAVNTLKSWLPESMRTNAVRTLGGLHVKHLVHLEDGRAQLTSLGERHVATSGLIAPV